MSTPEIICKALAGTGMTPRDVLSSSPTRQARAMRSALMIYLYNRTMMTATQVAACFGRCRRIYYKARRDLATDPCVGKWLNHIEHKLSTNVHSGG